MGFSMQGEFKRYLFEYRHDNSEWALEIHATSPQDAQARLRALAWAHYKGEIKLTIHIPSGGFFLRIAHLLKKYVCRLDSGRP
jgi:hypothetical protein